MKRNYYGVLVIFLVLLSVFVVLFSSRFIPRKAVNTRASAADTTSSCRWQAVQTPNVGNGTNFLYSIKAINNTDVWAVGSYYDSQSQSYKNLALQWDGQNWNVMNVPSQGAGNNFLTFINAVSPTDLWLVNNSYYNGTSSSVLLHGDGQTWTPINLPNSANMSINRVDILNANNIWLIGDKSVSQSVTAYLVHWNGVTWKQVDISAYHISYSDIKALSDTDVWIVGQKVVNNLRQTYALHWNGTTWIEVPTPNGNLPESELGIVAGLSANDIWADGLTYDSNQGIYHPLVVHWDGNSWSSSPLPNFKNYSTFVYDIFPNSAKDVLIAGVYFPSDTKNSVYMMRWNGTSWNQETIANVGQSENTLWRLSGLRVPSLTKPDVWAAGYSSDVFTQTHNFIEKYSCNNTLNVQVNPASPQPTLSCTPKPLCANPYDPRCLMMKISNTNWCK